MDMNKKKIMNSFLCITTVLSMLTTGCTSKEIKPNKDMVLKINRAPSLAEKELDTPWHNPSFTTGLSFRALFITDPVTEEIKPDLAESYTVSSDGLTYEILLKENQLWSDGEAITIDDIVFSIESVFGWDKVNSIFLTSFSSIVGANAFIRGEAESISGIVVDGNKLTITLLNPVSVFAKTLSQFSILPKHCLEDIPSTEHEENEYWNNPVVSGMYKLSNKDDTTSEYIYNENYSGEPPYINSVVYSWDFEDDFDYLDTNDIYSVFDYRGLPNKVEYKVDSTFYRYFVFNIIKGGNVDPVMNDIRVREAIINAINFKSIVASTYLNMGTFYDKMAIDEEKGVNDNSDFSYNPERAKELLAEAEYNFDRPLVLLDYYTDETSDDFMELTKGYLEEVGFTVELIPVGNLFTDEFDNYDIGLKGLSALDSTEWYTEYYSNYVLHNSVWGGEPVFDELLDDFLATEDATEKSLIEKDLIMMENSLLYKFPIFTMGYMVYVDKSRLELSEKAVFANPRYRYDVDFENWKILID